MAEGYLWWQPRGSPGFDGWIQLIREEFETEDQAIDGEKSRLRTIGRVKRRQLEASGVQVELIGLSFDCGIVYSPPETGEECVWAIDHFKERMLEYVASDDELTERLLQHQRAVHGVEPLLKGAHVIPNSQSPAPGALGRDDFDEWALENDGGCKGEEGRAASAYIGASSDEEGAGAGHARRHAAALRTAWVDDPNEANANEPSDAADATSEENVYRRRAASASPASPPEAPSLSATSTASDSPPRALPAACPSSTAASALAAERDTDEAMEDGPTHGPPSPFSGAAPASTAAVARAPPLPAAAAAEHAAVRVPDRRAAAETLQRSWRAHKQRGRRR